MRSTRMFDSSEVGGGFSSLSTPPAMCREVSVRR